MPWVQYHNQINFQTQVLQEDIVNTNLRNIFFTMIAFAILAAACGGFMPARATETPIPTETLKPTCAGPEGFVEMTPGMEAVFSWESQPLGKIGWDGINITVNTAEKESVYPMEESGMLSMELTVYEAGSPIGQVDVEMYVCVGGSIYLDSRFFKNKDPNVWALFVQQ